MGDKPTKKITNFEVIDNESSIKKLSRSIIDLLSTSHFIVITAFISSWPVTAFSPYLLPPVVRIKRPFFRWKGDQMIVIVQSITTVRFADHTGYLPIDTSYYR